MDEIGNYEAGGMGGGGERTLATLPCLDAEWGRGQYVNISDNTLL